MIKGISFERKTVVLSTFLFLLFLLSVLNCFSFSNYNIFSDVTYYNTANYNHTGRSSGLICGDHLLLHNKCRISQNIRIGEFSKSIYDSSQRYLTVSKFFLAQVLLRSASIIIPHFYSFKYLIFNSLFDLKTSLLIYH